MSELDIVRRLVGGGMRDSTTVGAQPASTDVRYGNARSDATGEAGHRTVNVLLDGAATACDLACDCPVSEGDRVTVVLQGGSYKVVSAASMDREQSAQREEIDGQAQLIEQVSGQVEQARQQAQAAQQAAEEAGGRADDALEAAQQAAGDAQAGVAEAKQAAEEASERAEELAGQVSEVRTEVEGLSSTVSGAVDTAEGALSMATEVGQSLESYKVEASQTYLDKATGETLATKAELEAKADEITLAVSEEYATKAELDGISVGGRNLAENTGALTTGMFYDMSQSGTGSIGEDTKVPSGQFFRFANASGQDLSVYAGEASLNYIEKLTVGETYTVSAWVRVGTAVDANFSMAVEFFPENQRYGYVPASTEWQRVSVTGEYNGNVSSSVAICFYERRSLGDNHMDISSIKVERGTIPTDWTPAPEDAEERYATKAELTVAEDSITAQVSEVATTADAAMSKATEVEQTAEGLSAEVSQVSQTADGAVTQLATLTATVEGISSEVSVAQETADSAVEAASQAQQSIDGFKTQVGNTYQTKADADSAMAQERLDRQSAIEQSATQITQTVSETYATIEQVDSISVGGRNMLLNSDFTAEFAQLTATMNEYGMQARGGTYAATRDESTMRGGKPCLKIVGSAAGNTSGKDIVWAFSPVDGYLQTGTLTGRSVCFSFWAMAASGSPVLYARLGYEGYDKTERVTLGTSWQRYSIVISGDTGDDFKATAGACRCLIFYLTSACTVWLSECKVELGSMATDWTPAPEDMATTAQVSSAIEQSAEEIALSVQQTYQPKGDYITGPEAASTYASKSELSVAEEAITSQVSEVAETASGAYSLASSVQQTAEGLEVEITAAQESADEAAKTATSYLRVTQSGLEVGTLGEDGGHDGPYTVQTTGGTFDVMSADGELMARVEQDAISFGNKPLGGRLEVSYNSGLCKILATDGPGLEIGGKYIILMPESYLQMDVQDYSGSKTYRGLVRDFVTAEGGTPNDWEWRKWASGKWEAWAIYGGLSCKPNGTTDLKCTIPSAIGNTANNYVVLCTFTRQGNSSAADGWSKLAWVVLNQAASGFTVRIWGDNSFASPYIPMMMSVLVLGRP